MKQSVIFALPKLAFRSRSFLCQPLCRNGYRQLSCSRSALLSSSSISPYSFVTTPIFYANSRPHIGHVYTAVLADAYHRFQMIRHEERLKFAGLFTGVDEHGMKIEKAAKAAKCKSVMDHCNTISGEFRKMSDQFSIDYCDFIRTTEDRHKEAVTYFWVILHCTEFLPHLAIIF